MLVGTKLIRFLLNWDLQPLSTSHVIWSAEGYPNLTVSGQAFLGQFSSTIVLILTGKITCRHLNSTIFFIQKWFISIENTPGNKIHANTI